MGILLKLVDFFKARYTHMLSCICADGCDSDWFPIRSGMHQACVVAPDLFLTPIDWLIHRSDHCSFLGTTIGTEPFTDADFVDDVALLTAILTVLLLALKIMDHKAKSLGLQLNWSKTNIQSTDVSFPRAPLCPWLETMSKSPSLSWC